VGGMGCQGVRGVAGGGGCCMSRGQQRGMYEDTHTHTKALAHTDTRGAGKRVYPKGAELWHFESGQSALCNNVAPSSQTFKLSNIKDAVLGFCGLIAHKSALKFLNQILVYNCLSDKSS